MEKLKAFSVAEDINKAWLEQFEELLNIQRELDMHIQEKNGLGEVGAEYIVTPLLVECSEFVAELPETFKFWKKTAKNNYAKALEEYVDILHFILSFYYKPFKDMTMDEKDLCGSYLLTDYYDTSINNNVTLKDEIKTNEAGITLGSWLMYMAKYVDNYEFNGVVQLLFAIGHYLEFTWEEIYDAYKSKNEVNHERQNNDY